MKFLFVLFPFFCLSQRDTLKFTFDNSFSTILNNTTLTLNSQGENAVSYKELKLVSNVNYLLVYDDTVKNNEFLHKLNVGYDNFFFSHVYNQSYSRKINSENLYGVGTGVKFEFGKSFLSFSYAVLYQSTNYRDSNDFMCRNSFRTKGSFQKNWIDFSIEYYYQPSFKLAKDPDSGFRNYIIYGTTKVVFFPEKKFSFTIQDNLNYRSMFKPIHTLSFGVRCMLSKEL